MAVEKNNSREKRQTREEIARRRNLLRKRRIRRNRLIVLAGFVSLIIVISLVVKIFINGEESNQILSVQEESKSVIISIGGDCVLGTDDSIENKNSFSDVLSSKKDYGYFMQNIQAVIGNDDYTLVNLESPLTSQSQKSKNNSEDEFCFKGSADNVSILTNSSIEGVNLSNDHIYDYGSLGFEDTVQVLTNNKIDFCGEGYKIIKDINGVNVGFLGYTGWGLTDELRDKISSDIQELRYKGADIIIPYFHWGNENDADINEVQTKVAMFAIDNGADMVIGSHPKLIQGMENYKGKLIVYSMGNLCYGAEENVDDMDSFILQIKVSETEESSYKLEYRVVPIKISSVSDSNDYKPTIAKNDEKTDILDRLNDLSEGLDGKISDKYFGIE